MSEIRHSYGTDYIYLFLRLIISISIFLFWSSAIDLFDNNNWDLFFPLFTITVISGLFARIVAYSFLWLLNYIMNRKRTTKRVIPTFFQLNFSKSINRYSFISIFSTIIMCLIYAFGIDAFIIEYFFPTRTMWTDLLGYIIIKAGASVMSWIFLKTR